MDREGISQSAYLETHFTFRCTRRTPKRDIDLPLGWEDQEHDEIRNYRAHRRHSRATSAVSCWR
jgi:hypothetical protein